MDVIADASAVGRGIVGAKNVDVWGAAESDFENPGDEVRLRLVGFALVRTKRSRRIEIAQAGIAQAVNLMEPGQHSLHQQLRFAVGVGRTEGIVLLDRSAIGIAIKRRRRRENKTLD